MKRYFFSLLFLLGALCAQAESKLYFEELKIKPGETKAIELKLQNEDVVKGLQLVLSLTEGLSFVENEDEEEYAVGTDRCSFLSSLLKANGSLGIAGFAQKKKDYIAVGDGTIATVLVKADESLALGTGTITISDVELVFSTNPTENPATSSYDIRIYEVFKVNVFSSDDKMGGAVSTASEAESGEEVTVTASPLEGYHFVKWSDDVTDNPYTFSVTGNVDLTAEFAPNQYVMTFVLDNGDDDVVMTQDYATALTAPEDPERTGFTFKGWTPEVPATVPAEDMTFNAQWEVNTYAVIYIVNGEEWARDSVAYGAPIEVREYSPEDGYNFSGWQCDDEYTTMPAHDVTYTADITTGMIRTVGENRPVSVYSINGRLLCRNLPVSELRQRLPAGVYIADGKKVIVH